MEGDEGLLKEALSSEGFQGLQARRRLLFEGGFKELERGFKPSALKELGGGLKVFFFFWSVPCALEAQTVINLLF